MWKCPKCAKEMADYGRGPHSVTCGRTLSESGFWNFVDKSGECWIWTGAKTSAGYGAISRHGKNTLAHRAAWVDAHGKIPEGKILLHVCDNPLCVRPAHLRIGSDAENHLDKRLKGRDPRLQSPDKVRQVRALLGTMPQSAIAKLVGMPRGTVNKIKMGKSYSWLP